MPTFVPHLLGWIAALLITLCLGGLWSLLTLMAGTELPWFAVVVGLGVLPASLFLRPGRRSARLVGLPLLALVGMAYAHALSAATAVARASGLDFGEVVGALGLPLLLDLAWLRSAPAEVAWMAFGLLVGVAGAWWLAGPTGRRETGPAG